MSRTESMQCAFIRGIHAHVSGAAVGGDVCDGGRGGAEGEVWGYEGLGRHGGLGGIVVGLASTGEQEEEGRGRR